VYDVVVKSLRSLSHLLMSFFLYITPSNDFLHNVNHFYVLCVVDKLSAFDRTLR